jgi:hypothetical protein
MTSLPVAARPVERVTYPPLKPADRSCANPSAQALVRVAKDGVDLLFDGHAFTLHEPSLLAQGWEIVEDIREAVLNPPKSAFDTSEN